MPESEPDPRLARLLANLDEAAALLREHGETHWLSWLTRCRAALVGHDVDAYDRILEGFGGMGSFNDLHIHAVNGHAVRAGEEKGANEQLWNLRHLIWTDATALHNESSNSS